MPRWRAIIIRSVSPRGVPAKETLRFLESVLPRGARILEVGCGLGDVAAGLLKANYRVCALDSDAASVEAAAARGVDAVRANFLFYEDGPFDAVTTGTSAAGWKRARRVFERVGDSCGRRVGASRGEV